MISKCLTSIEKFDILNQSSGWRIFYANNGLLVGARNLTVSLMTAEKSPFLLGGKMKAHNRIEIKKGHLDGK